VDYIPYLTGGSLTTFTDSHVNPPVQMSNPLSAVMAPPPGARYLLAPEDSVVLSACPQNCARVQKINALLGVSKVRRLDRSSRVISAA
jgi:hypothetical protein